jgi:RNase P/RNase MRP subunit p29
MPISISNNEIKSNNLQEKFLSKKTKRILEDTKIDMKFNENKDNDHIDNDNIKDTNKDKEICKKENLSDLRNKIKEFKFDYNKNYDVIDNDIYQIIPINNLDKNKQIKNKEDKEENLNNILLPLFPNEKVFYSEFTNEKIFLLDKFISKGDQKKKKNQKNKEINSNDIENDNMIKAIHNSNNKIFKKPKESSFIKILKENKTLKYDLLLESMNPIWKNYIKSYLNKALNYDTIYAKLVKADFHGAIIKIQSSNNKNEIGIEGINLLETKRTFSLITKKNEIKTILKKGTLFNIDLSFAYEDIKNNDDNQNLDGNSNKNQDMEKDKPKFSEKNPSMKLEFPIILKILGDNFMYKSSFRSKAKYKTKYII